MCSIFSLSVCVYVHHEHCEIPNQRKLIDKPLVVFGCCKQWNGASLRFERKCKLI